jgi:type I restriction enzyme, R subunit
VPGRPDSRSLADLWVITRPLAWQQRAEIIASLEEKGISFDALATATHQPDADPLDLLCYIVFSTPLRTRRERANRLRREERDFLGKYKPLGLRVA